MRQLGFKLRTWGGKRKGAGRPPKGDRAGVSHLRRPELKPTQPVHVTLKVRPGLGYLRSQRRRRGIEQAFAQARERLGMRLVHYSIQGAHLHLIVEAADRDALSTAMQGLAIRLARLLNRLAQRASGKVFADRFHAHVLATRRETAAALRYVLDNVHHHAREDVRPAGVDPCSSAHAGAPVAAARTWLLRSALLQI